HDPAPTKLRRAIEATTAPKARTASMSSMPRRYRACLTSSPLRTGVQLKVPEFGNRGRTGNPLPVPGTTCRNLAGRLPSEWLSREDPDGGDQEDRDMLTNGAQLARELHTLIGWGQ